MGSSAPHQDMDSLTNMNRPGAFCGHPGCGPIAQLFGWVRGGSVPCAWPGFDDGRVVPTHSGRAAIALAARAWRIGKGDEVLIPAYNCGSEIDAIASSGASLIPYRVDERAAIDLDDIVRRTTDRTRVVYVTHYFGWPQDLSELAAWCRQRHLLLLGDCALSLFSTPIDQPIGVHGDAMIYSFRKTLAVPDGGALVLRRGELSSLPTLGPARPPTIARASLSLLRNFMLQRADAVHAYPALARIPGLARRPKRRGPGLRPDIPSRYYFNAQEPVRGISRVSAGLLRAVDPANVIARRRENYDVLHDALAGAPGAPALTPLFNSLPSGACPLTFPVRIRNRHAWRAELAGRRIASVPWWSGYHRALTWDHFPEACALKDTVLGLPIHHQLTAVQIRAVARAVREVADLFARSPEALSDPAERVRASAGDASSPTSDGSRRFLTTSDTQRCSIP